jgi:hypothetical protein
MPSDSLADRQVRLSMFVEDIGKRLRPACAHLAPDDFDRLVRDIAEMQLRFQDRDHEGFEARFELARRRLP